jgi:hypothetical protein
MRELMYNAKMEDSYRKIEKFLFDLGFEFKEIPYDASKHSSIKIPTEEHTNLISFCNKNLHLNIYFFKCKSIFKIYLAGIFLQMNQIKEDKIIFVNSDTFINFLNVHILNAINEQIDNLYKLKLKCQAL